MVTGFYAALAGAASVFIGILTALLASNLSNLNAQRERIQRRIEAIDARLENLYTQYEHFRNTVETIREREEAKQQREQAQKQVDDFIDEYIGDEFSPSPEEVTSRELMQEFADYLGIDQLNEYQHEALQDHHDEIISELTPRSPFDPIGIPDNALVDPAITATNNQIEHQWQIHTEERHNRNYRRAIQTKTEIESLKEERQRLANRHESLDPDHIRSSLRATIVTIVLSVGVPIIAYLLVITGLTISRLPAWSGPTVIFILWVIGLVYVFNHLRDQLNEESGELPNEPEITIDEV